MRKNVRRRSGFEQVCIWEDMFVGKKFIKQFEADMLKHFGARVQYLEEIKTRPDTDPLGKPVPGTGGRNDLIFAVHTDDLSVFAPRRLRVGIRWIEDVLSSVNYLSPIYPKRVHGYRSWDADATLPDAPFDWSVLIGYTVENATCPHMR